MKQFKLFDEKKEPDRLAQWNKIQEEEQQRINETGFTPEEQTGINQLVKEIESKNTTIRDYYNSPENNPELYKHQKTYNSKYNINLFSRTHTTLPSPMTKEDIEVFKFVQILRDNHKFSIAEIYKTFREENIKLSDLAYNQYSQKFESKLMEIFYNHLEYSEILNGLKFRDNNK